MRYNVEIESDHFQVLIGDRVRGPHVDTTDLWHDEQKVVAVLGAPELVAIGTARFGGKTRIQVEVALSEPEPQADWNEMGNFVLALPSGEILFWAPESPDLKRVPGVPVDPGKYLGRAFSRGTGDVVDEMATEGPDEYRIVLWRAA